MPWSGFRDFLSWLGVALACVVAIAVVAGIFIGAMAESSNTDPRKGWVYPIDGPQYVCSGPGKRDLTYYKGGTVPNSPACAP